jgi:DNA-binding MarR family transcriptional regulator
MLRIRIMPTNDGTLAAAMSDPPSTWRPDPERQTSILFDVFVLGQRVRALVGTAMDGAGLRPDEYAVYSVVFEAGSVTLTGLAGKLGMPVTTVADYVRAMLERGHARRHPHPRDGRARLLSLTAGGLRTHRRASAAFERAYRSLTEELTVPEDRARVMLQELAGGAERALRSLEDRATGTGSR